RWSGAISPVRTVLQRLRRVEGGAAEVRRRVAREPDVRRRELPLAGAARELEVALEHLRHTVHASVADGPASGEDRESTASGADGAVLHEAVGFAESAVAE